MKRQIAMIALLFLGMGMTASAQFGKKFNVGKALQAGKDVVSAVTLSDADIANMSKEYMVWMDAHNPLTKPDTEYGKRLEKLTGHIKEMDGLKLNFGVYEVVDVNAFACGDALCYISSNRNMLFPVHPMLIPKTTWFRHKECTEHRRCSLPSCRNSIDAEDYTFPAD
jgi:hypothetical protein